MINEQALATFIEIALCDRRTAAWCMSRFRNMDSALAFYFDMPRIDIPEDFDPDAVTASTTLSEPISTIPERPPPPPPPPPMMPPVPSQTESASLDTNEIIAFKFSGAGNQQPTLFLPLGHIQFQAPNLPESLWEDAENPTETEHSIFSDTDSQTISCTVWRNGISWGDQFFNENTAGYSEALRQLEMNQLPTALIPEIPPCDVDLIFRKATTFEFNS